MPYGNGFTYMIITQVLFFIVTIVLILWFIINSKQKEIYTAKEILDKRLVFGKINNKEYDSLLKKIQKEVRT
ncbi:MAG: hypothetical protein KAI26_01200 [Nanoarchaeota archaeon]|nr:hypothetical protein [Nanoarchaeota archaeon]